MNELDKPIETLISERNDFEKENIKLKAELAGYRSRVCSMCDGHGLVGNCLDSMDCPDCTKVMNNVKADAIHKMIHLMPSSFESKKDEWNYFEEYIDKLRGT